MPPKCHEPYPVAMIPYANMLPYRLLGTPPRCRWCDYVPRKSVEALAAGRVMAAAVPVGALPGLEDRVEPLGLYGIAAGEASMSVLFFSRRPFDQISAHDRIRITPDSATSVRLLYLLLGCQKSARGASSSGDDSEAVGELLIGDRAMQRMYARRRTAVKMGRHSGSGYYGHVTDLATRWYERHLLPFVFARWVIRRDAPPEARAILREWLNTFAEQEDMLVCRSIPIAARQLGLPETCTAHYYRCLRRVLGEADLKGQALFLQEIRRHRIDPFERWQALLPNDATGRRISYPSSSFPTADGFQENRGVGETPWLASSYAKEVL